MLHPWLPTGLYAFAHFTVDLGCAFAMFSACSRSASGFLLYNFFAFAMQMPLGLLADVLRRNRWFAVIGALLVAVMCCIPSFGLVGAAVLGLGNGLFHIGGGLDVLNLSGDRAAPLGVFVSPGAYGIFLGTLLGKSGFSPLPVLSALLLACGSILMIRPTRLLPNAPLRFPARRVFPWAALLFAVVILRSFGGMTGSFPWKTGPLAFAAVSAVVLGKSFGGFLSDRLGMVQTAAASLALSALLFCFSQHALWGLLALLLFNMTMPMTLFALARVMPGCKGFSFGLLTFALFLGFLPSYMGAGSISGGAMALVCLLSVCLLVPAAAVCGRREVHL